MVAYLVFSLAHYNKFFRLRCLESLLTCVSLQLDSSNFCSSKSFFALASLLRVEEQCPPSGPDAWLARLPRPVPRREASTSFDRACLSLILFLVLLRCIHLADPAKICTQHCSGFLVLQTSNSINHKIKLSGSKDLNN